MTDDFLDDFERELHAAAQRRRERRAPRARRRLVPALAAGAALAGVFVVLSLAGAPEREVEVPPAPQPAAQAGADCAPSAAMRRVVPALDREPPAGGVPPAIRASGATAHARVWGGGDGITYWVVPRLRCDGADEDAVCVVPLFDEEAGSEGAGGSACSRLGETSWIHFPLRDGGAAVAGIAPPGAGQARVRVREGGHTQRFAVRDGVWGGTLDGYRPRGEVGSLDVDFDVPKYATPSVAVLNGTTVTGLGGTVMDALKFVNYREAEGGVGDWSEHDLDRTVVFHAPHQRWLGDRIAIYLSEKFDVARPVVREMSDEARELGGEDADAVIVAGRDVAR